MATRAIEKGMPIEQVQKILGHDQIDTTLRYAIVNQNNVKIFSSEIYRIKLSPQFQIWICRDDV